MSGNHDFTSGGDAFERDLRRLPLGQQRATREARLEALWALSPEDRVYAMRAGELTLEQLAAWSARHPEQVPRIGGEFEWIVVSTVDWIEASPQLREGLRRRGGERR